MSGVIVAIVEALTLGRIRGQHYAPEFPPSLRWWYIGKRAERFKHGGWVCLSPSWFRRYWKAVAVQREAET